MFKSNWHSKSLIFVFVFFVVLFFCTPNTKAATEDDQVIKDRFAGSIVLEDRHFDKLYWYIEPESQERYLLKNGETLSRILKNLSTGISDQNLNNLPKQQNTNDINWSMTNRLKGKFLLQVEDQGKIWYLNPLDQKVYQIANGKEGLETLQNLAIEIDADKLNLFLVGKKLIISEPAELTIDFSIYWDVWNKLKMDHYNSDALDDVERFYGSLKGMADAMDDSYTQFFTPQNNEFFQDNLEGSIEGIGAIVDVVDGIFTIVSPLGDSPAHEAGLKAHDQVLSVDDINIKDFKLEDSILLIRGPKDSSVKLEIYRPSTKKTFFVSIKRDKIDIPFVEYESLDNDIAYIKIHMFSEDMIKEFEKAKEATIDDNTKGIIIDLRNNPGGYTSIVRKLTDYWLDPGDKIYSEKYADSTKIYSAYSEKEIDLPTIILTNNGTASASEIFTAALTEHGLAQTVGVTSFGKGTGQSIETFSDGSALKFTIFEWLTPDNNSVFGLGLEPDFVVENTNEKDLQLLKAKNLLK